MMSCSASRREKALDDAKRMKFSANEFFYKTREQMEEALPGFEEATRQHLP